MEPAKPATRVPIRALALYYLRLGLLGFGGPVALVGQMEREMVGERKWLTKEEMREASPCASRSPDRSPSRSASGSRTFAARSSATWKPSWPR